MKVKLSRTFNLLLFIQILYNFWTVNFYSNFQLMHVHWLKGPILKKINLFNKLHVLQIKTFNYSLVIWLDIKYEFMKIIMI